MNYPKLVPTNPHALCQGDISLLWDRLRVEQKLTAGLRGRVMELEAKCGALEARLAGLRAGLSALYPYGLDLDRVLALLDDKETTT